MSLFDVIKYGSIDLTDASEVRKLPTEVLNKVWAELYTTSPKYDYQVKHLVEVTSDLRMDELRDALNKVLKEHDEPI